MKSGALSRSKRYARLTPEDMRFFASVDPQLVLGDAEPHFVDWMKKYRAKEPSAVLAPRSTAQVSAVLAHCNRRRLAVVPQGGNTGLVGGSVPVFDELVLSMSRMNRVLEVCADTSVVTCEAGVVLEALQQALEPHQLTIPIDLGAKGSCQVGGNVATNAGGVHLLRYGSLHGSVLGLECVLADGTIVDLDSKMRKDNTGFDMKQLFVGSEGALGIITKVTLAVPPLPKSRSVVFVGLDSFANVRRLLRLAKAELGEVLSAFEMLDRQVVELCEKHCVGVKNPLASGPAPFYVLVEVAGSNAAHDAEKVSTFTEKALEQGIVLDGTMAQDLQQARSIWRVREAAPEAVLHAGGRPFKYDISLPLDNFYDIVEQLRARIGTRGVVTGYGHVGDCNLHLNVSSADPDVVNVLEPFTWEYVQRCRGSVSAEHGVGLQKVDKMGFSKSSAALALIRATKLQLDPNLILNPYKVVAGIPWD
jgi:D-2-hydroxyglutarate dehydrogenase